MPGRLLAIIAGENRPYPKVPCGGDTVLLETAVSACRLAGATYKSQADRALTATDLRGSLSPRSHLIDWLARADEPAAESHTVENLFLIPSRDPRGRMPDREARCSISNLMQGEPQLSDRSSPTGARAKSAPLLRRRLGPHDRAPLARPSLVINPRLHPHHCRAQYRPRPHAPHSTRPVLKPTESIPASSTCGGACRPADTRDPLMNTGAHPMMRRPRLLAAMTFRDGQTLSYACSTEARVARTISAAEGWP